MARVGRLAGALLAETDGHYLLVGQTKRPCDWAAAGFEPPASAGGVVRLVGTRPCTATWPVLDGPDVIEIAIEGESLAPLLVQRFVIERNGSVSERLWNLVIRRGVIDDDGGAEGPGDDGGTATLRTAVTADARWLGEIPDGVWQIVRDVVLRCT